MTAGAISVLSLDGETVHSVMSSILTESVGWPTPVGDNWLESGVLRDSSVKLVDVLSGSTAREVSSGTRTGAGNDVRFSAETTAQRGMVVGAGGGFSRRLLATGGSTMDELSEPGTSVTSDPHLTSLVAT